MDLNEKIRRTLCSLKKKKPLVHQITNYVTANDCANIILAIGAVTVMADSIDEVDEMLSLADALVINLGTLNQRKLETMLKAGKKANELGIPIILDPVGVGATTFRKEAATLIMRQLKLSIIRGNLSEIKTLNGVETSTIGVESKEILSLQQHCFMEGRQMAKVLAQKLGTVVAVTGEVDIITDGRRCYSIQNGSSIMAKVTGTGCMCSALIGAYAGAIRDANENESVIPDYLIAAVSGVVSIGIAGEAAYEKIKIHNEGIGSFRVRLMDEIYFLTEGELENKSKIYQD